MEIVVPLLSRSATQARHAHRGAWEQNNKTK